MNFDTKDKEYLECMIFMSTKLIQILSKEKIQSKTKNVIKFMILLETMFGKCGRLFVF